MKCKTIKRRNDQESIKSSTTPDQTHKRAKRSALFQQVNTRLQETTKINTNNKNDPQKKHRLGRLVRKLLEGLNFVQGTNRTLSSVVAQNIDVLFA